MQRAEFFNVHKEFAQDTQNGPIYGHEEFLGLNDNDAKAKYHELLAAVYRANDPWSFVFIVGDTGIMSKWETVDRRTEQPIEPILEET